MSTTELPVKLGDADLSLERVGEGTALVLSFPYTGRRIVLPIHSGSLILELAIAGQTPPSTSEGI